MRLIIISVLLFGCADLKMDVELPDIYIQMGNIDGGEVDGGKYDGNYRIDPSWNTHHDLVIPEGTRSGTKKTERTYVTAPLSRMPVHQK